MGLHPAHRTAGGPKQLCVAVVQLIVVAPQLCLGGRGPAPCAAQQGRVCDQPPAHHDGGQAREPCLQLQQFLRCGHVAVVAHRHPALRQGSGKGRTIRLPAVQLLHHPWVDGQLTDGVFCVDCQNGPELLRFFHAKPRFDGHRPARLGEHCRQERIQRFRIPEHPGPLALCRHRAGRTAEVQVDFRIAQLPQLADHPGCQLAVLAQQLRDHRNAGVCRRVQLRHLLFDEHAVLRRRKERRIVPLRCALRPEPALVGLPPDPVCQPLHRGGIVVHTRILNCNPPVNVIFCKYRHKAMLALSAIGWSCFRTRSHLSFHE